MTEQLPERITLEALALSPAEQRAFPRWYTDLLLRKRSESVAIGDVLSFLDNFGISHADKMSIVHMFSGGQLVTLDPPQFYVFLRLTGHLLQGKQLRRELAFVAAPVPRPRSILSRKGHKNRTSAGSAKDMDSFMSLMMAGKNGVQKRKKRVTFDSRPPQVTEAAHRSMGELLRQQQHLEMLPLPRPPAPEPEPEPTPANQEPEMDQPIINNQFARVNIDSVLHNGQSILPEPPAPRKAKAGDSYIQQLTQQHTGASAQHTSAQPPQLTQQLTGNQQQPNYIASSSFIQQPAPQQPAPPLPRGFQSNGLQPQLTGPAVPSRLGTQGLQPQLTGPSIPQQIQPQIQPQIQQPMQPSIQPQIQPQLQQPMHQAATIQPNYTGFIPGMQVPMATAPTNIDSMQPQPQQLGPSLTGPANQMFQPPPPPPRSSSSTGVSPQVSGLSGMPMNMPIQPPASRQPPVPQLQPGLQFLNSVQQPSPYQIPGPPQYVRAPAQPYNMQQLRDQLPNW